MNWEKLQNGSDIRGVALEGVAGESVNLNTPVVQALAKAFVRWLSETKGLQNISIAVGRDSRLSGPALSRAFLNGAAGAGASVFDCGLASTPAMFMTTQSSSQPVSAGVMVTASHLPFNRNGLKFFTREGGLDKTDIAEILTLAGAMSVSDETDSVAAEKWNFMDEYAAGLVKYIRQTAALPTHFKQPLKGLKIIVDAGNGAGGFFASKVLEPLRADTRGSQFLEPDGHFPNHVPNPEDAEAMQSVCEAVIREKADLGIIFDTDVDRSAIVDAAGNPVNRNALIALISAVVLREHPGSTIVTDSITSEGLTRFIESDLKGKHHRFKRGYKNVINEAIRLNNQGQESWLAIETSGHAALKENYFLDDGAFLVAKLLSEMARRQAGGQQLTDLIANLQHPAEGKEFRFSITENDFIAYGNAVLEKMKANVAGQGGWEIVQPNYEGLRVRCTAKNEQGWFLLRLSLHDPVMPLNIESNVPGGVNSIKLKLADLLCDFDGLSTDCLR